LFVRPTAGHPVSITICHRRRSRGANTCKTEDQTVDKMCVHQLTSKTTITHRRVSSARSMLRRYWSLRVSRTDTNYEPFFNGAKQRIYENIHYYIHYDGVKCTDRDRDAISLREYLTCRRSGSPYAVELSSEKLVVAKLYVRSWVEEKDAGERILLLVLWRFPRTLSVRDRSCVGLTW
jgi:hypothetical protein